MGADRDPFEVRNSAGSALDRLQGLIRHLRGPDGCPWDQEQTLASCRSNLLEEAHETAAAIDHNDRNRMGEELGDLSFQVVFLADLAEDRGWFGFKEVLNGVVDKMVERHPHVFGEATARSAAEVKQLWQEQKRKERPERSALEGVPETLPALVAAHRLAEKAAGLGFDWPDTEGVFEKVREELAEVRAAGAQTEASRTAVSEEIGDLLFAVASLARHHGIDAEGALAGANQKFRRRFAWVERQQREAGGTRDLERLEAWWNEAKDQDLALGGVEQES